MHNQQNIRVVYDQLEGGTSLLLRVRGDFTKSGTSLNAWCQSNAVDHGHAHRVLRGITNGPAARKLRHRIATAAGSIAQ